MEQMKVGVSSFDSGSFVKSEYFKIEAGKDNVYRILPPLFSYASTGKWNQYYATHTIWIDKRPYHFQCMLKKDRDKNILQECPFCTAETVAKAKLESVKGSLSKEQLMAFEEAQIKPFQANKKVYMNAVNQGNVPGLLPVGFKLFESIRSLLTEFYNKNGVDATGTNGLFLNFKKTQAFKGDRNTSYSVEFYQAVTQNPDGTFTARYVNHTLTPELLSKVAAGGGKDLATLYSDITFNEAQALVSGIKANNPSDLKLLCDKIFSRSTKVTSTVETTVGGTNVIAVSPIVVTSNDVVVKPAYTAPAPAETPPWVSSPSIAPVAAQPTASSMSDDFFTKLMEG
jgi:hypothetical protein